MLGNRWFRVYILSGLSVMVFMAPTTAISQATLDRASLTPYAPILGNFINIWEDAVGNSNQEVIYNPERDEFLSLWISYQSDRSDVWARRISASGALLGWYTVYSTVGRRYVEADIAYSPQHHQYLVVLTQKIYDDDYDIHAVRFDDDGTDFSWFPIETESRIQQHPNVVYNTQQDEYLVVYENKKTDGFTETVAWRINGSNFLPIGTTRTTIAAVGAKQYRYDPAVAYNPARNNYLVAYNFEDENGPTAYIGSKTVSYDLTSLGPEVNLSNSFGMEPDIAVANDQFLVVWCNPPADDVGARRVNYDGQPFGASGGFHLSSSSTGLFYARRPHVSFMHNIGYWVAWDRFNGTTYDESDIYANIVFSGQDQPASTEFVVDDDLNYQGEPAIACRSFGPCLLTEVYNLSDYPLGDYDIRGRMLYLPTLFLPVVRK